MHSHWCRIDVNESHTNIAIQFDLNRKTNYRINEEIHRRKRNKKKKKIKNCALPDFVTFSPVVVEFPPGICFRTSSPRYKKRHHQQQFSHMNRAHRIQNTLTN